MNEIDKYKIYIKKYTDVDPKILNNIDNRFVYKNLYNFIIIQWNKCINTIKLDDKIKTEYNIVDNTLSTDIIDIEFYNLLNKFIEDENIMKIKFCILCINKYLSR